MSLQPLIPRDADFDLYPYKPSAEAGYAFLVLFAIGGTAHLFMMPFFRSWFFIPFILGCIGEAAGYYARAWSSSNIRNGGPYLIQLMLILASAPLISATIYMTLARLIYALDAREHAIMSPRWTTKIYVFIDIASFVGQMAGSAMQSSGDPAGIQLGINIVIAGLAVQLFAFGLFVLMAAVVHKRLNQQPTAISLHADFKWRRHMWVLYTVSMLVSVRSLFRLIEFAEGSKGVAYNTEALMYVFDSSLMFLVVAVMAVVHPGMLLRTIRKAEFHSLSDNNGAFLLRENNDK